MQINQSKVNQKKGVLFMKRILSAAMTVLLLFTMVAPVQATGMLNQADDPVSNDPAMITIDGVGKSFSAYKLLNLTTSLKAD